MRSPSLEAVWPALDSCEPWGASDPGDWLPLRLAVDDGLPGEPGADDAGLGEPPLDEELPDDELFDDELLDDWDRDEELLLGDELLDDGLGGGLLAEGVGMLGGCGIVGLLALGQPVRTSALESSTAAVVRRPAGKSRAVAGSRAGHAAATAFAACLPGCSPVRDVIGPTYLVCGNGHAVAEARAEQGLPDTARYIVCLVVKVRVLVEAFEIRHATPLVDGKF